MLRKWVRSQNIKKLAKRYKMQRKWIRSPNAKKIPKSKKPKILGIMSKKPKILGIMSKKPKILRKLSLFKLNGKMLRKWLRSPKC